MIQYSNDWAYYYITQDFLHTKLIGQYNSYQETPPKTHFGEGILGFGDRISGFGDRILSLRDKNLSLGDKISGILVKITS